jgi:hypothetical protein
VYTTCSLGLISTVEGEWLSVVSRLLCTSDHRTLGAALLPVPEAVLSESILDLDKAFRPPQNEKWGLAHWPGCSSVASTSVVLSVAGELHVLVHRLDGMGSQLAAREGSEPPSPRHGPQTGSVTMHVSASRGLPHTSREANFAQPRPDPTAAGPRTFAVGGGVSSIIRGVGNTSATSRVASKAGSGGSAAAKSTGDVQSGVTVLRLCVESMWVIVESDPSWTLGLWRSCWHKTSGVQDLLLRVDRRARVQALGPATQSAQVPRPPPQGSACHTNRRGEAKRQC